MRSPQVFARFMLRCFRSRGLGSGTAAVLHDMATHMTGALCASMLALRGKRKVMLLTDVKTAFRSWCLLHMGTPFPEAEAYAQNRVAAFRAYVPQEGATNLSASDRAGLLLSVNWTRKACSGPLGAARSACVIPVYITAALEMVLTDALSHVAPAERGRPLLQAAEFACSLRGGAPGWQRYMRRVLFAGAWARAVPGPPTLSLPPPLTGDLQAATEAVEDTGRAKAAAAEAVEDTGRAKAAAAAGGEGGKRKRKRHK